MEDKKEYINFSNLSGSWGQDSKEFKILHKISKIRLEYIKNMLGNITNLEGLDLGAGGGLITIPLAKQGAKMDAVDFTANEYITNNNLNINYYIDDIINFLDKSEKKYDFIIMFEVLEHLDDYESAIKLASNLLKDGGVIIFSTIARNYKSLFLAKFCAEYILRWVPRGLHDFTKFINPSEIIKIAQKSGLNIMNISGLKFNIFKQEWVITNNPDVNYFLTMLK